ncbi:MAG: hypothetical protein ACYDH6_15495 [Acidimicrobiales bacterium]
MMEPDARVRVDDARVDVAIAALAIPIAERAPLLDRAGAFARELTATPRRAALCTAWGFVALIAFASLSRTSGAVRTTTGPGSARCGLDVFVSAHPGTNVTQVCRHAEVARLAVFVPAMIAVIAGLVAATLLSRRSGGRISAGLDALRGAPVHAGLIVLGALGAAFGSVALVPAHVEIVRDGTLTTARCGVDTSLFGYPDATVEHACRHAYSGQGHIVLGATVIALVGLGALGHLLFRGRDRGPLARRQLVGAAFAVALAIIVLGALRPVQVTVAENGGTAIARCGLDSYIGGYPDHAVQVACRSNDGTHAATALGAVVLIVVGLGAFGLTRGERRRVT